MTSSSATIGGIMFLVFSSLIASGQPGGYVHVPSRFEPEYIQLQIKENNESFYDIAEDNQGFLWFAGLNGLKVFDGVKTITYRSDNPQFLLNPDSIQRPLFSICKTPQGKFWISEQSARYFLFDPASRKIEQMLTMKRWPNEKFHYSAMGDDEHFYLASINYHTQLLSIFRHDTSDSLVRIFSDSLRGNTSFRYKFAGGFHWIIMNGYISRISRDGKTRKRYQIADGSESYYSYVNADSATIYLVDQKGKSIYCWNREKDQMQLFAPIPPTLSPQIHYFCVKDSNVYIGGGLNFFILDVRHKTFQDLSDMLISLAKRQTVANLSDISMRYFFNAEDELFICMRKSLYRMKKTVPSSDAFLERIDNGEKKKPLSFRAITQDSEGNIYASYYTGLVKKTPNEQYFRTLPTQSITGTQVPSTYSLSYWSGHLLWNNAFVNPGTLKKQYLALNHYAGHCTQFIRNDSLWLYQWFSDRLYNVDLKTGTTDTFLLDRELAGENASYGEMNDMAGAGNGGGLWISSSEHGISQIDSKGKLLKQYNPMDFGSSDNRATDLYISGNNLWFGCSDGLGLINVISGQGTIFRNPVILDDGVITNRAVFSILQNKDGNFYLGTSYGLLFFNTRTDEFEILSPDHPLAGIEFNRASAFRSGENRFYFGTTDGLYSFVESDLQFQPVSNQIHRIKLISYSVFNTQRNKTSYHSQELDSIEQIILQPFENTLELMVAVPDLHRDIYYSYRVRGLNDNWSEYTTNSSIKVNGLQAGAYWIDIKASSSLNDQNATYYSLPIIMMQVWYRKWWVIPVVILLLTSILFFLLRWRYRQRLRRQKELALLRTKISSDLHDDVGTILSGLAMESQMLTYTANPEQKIKLNEISAMSREAMEHMRDIVWAMDSRKDKLENLVDRMREFAERQLAIKHFTHEFRVVHSNVRKFLDPAKRQNIYFIFKEAITNIIRHCDGNHVLICITEDKSGLQLFIKDNGAQVNCLSSDGLGLSNMKMRAEQINGTLCTGYENGFYVDLRVTET